MSASTPAPKFGEFKSNGRLDVDQAMAEATVAQTAATHAQVKAIEKKADVFNALSLLVGFTAFVVLSAAVPLEIFFWHLALK